jgi:hypothetical protein
MQYYLIDVCAPSSCGPFASSDARDMAALDLHASSTRRSQPTSPFWINIDARGRLTLGAYSANFFKADRLIAALLQEVA